MHAHAQMHTDTRRCTRTRRHMWFIYRFIHGFSYSFLLGLCLLLLLLLHSDAWHPC